MIRQSQTTCSVAALTSAILIALTTCNSPNRDADRLEPESIKASSPADSVFPTPDMLVEDTPSIALHSITTLLVTRGSSVVTITDEKELRLKKAAQEGGRRDFQLYVKRGHTGAESGDTHETFTAIRIGRDYWTRGSGGPFVWWDDALHEPDSTLAKAAGETHSLLELAAPCIRLTNNGGSWQMELASPACRAASALTAAPMAVEFNSIEGKSTWSGRIPGSFSLKMAFVVQAEGHTAQVSLEHEASVRDLAPDETIEPPEGAISSRRARPVKMLEKVLSGLVKEWGPGAPNVLKQK
ncbi:MAG: hypothetical protein GXP54_13030 [Deltaproteobacteria bacterium]|nr:hypothetical protein [Deltaproteobacteria bacterium]